MVDNEQGNWFETLVDEFDLPLFVIGEDGEFEYISEEFAAVFEDSTATILEEHPAEFLPEEDVPELEAVLESANETEETEATTIRVELSDGFCERFRVCSVNGSCLGYPASRSVSLSGLPAGETDANSLESFVRILEQLHDVTNRLYRSESVDDGLDIVTNAAVEVLGFDWCLLMTVEDRMFEIRKTTSESPLSVGDRPLEAHNGIAGVVYQTGTARVTDDIRESDEAHPTHSYIRSAVTVPVGSWGVFQVLSRSPGAFNERDRQLAETLIAPLATMIERVEREGELRESNATQEQQRRQIEALHTIATQMKTATSRTNVYEMTIEAVEDILEFDICIIDEVEDGVLVPKAVGSNMSIDDYYEETPLDQPDNLGSLTYQNRRTYVIDDLHDAGFAPAQSRFTSALSIPFGDSGLFQIAAEEKGAFDDTDKRLAELLTEHAVAAIDRIEREQELERRAEELEEKNERLDEFASIVSHDLRNPLNVATLRADHTLRTGEIESVEAIQDALDRMVTIIGDVLTLARQGQGIEEVNPVTLHQLTAQSWEQILTENASLNVEQGVVIEADGGRLEHLFENLFRNAIDHAGDDVTVRVGTLPESDGFFVEDDGPGIDEEIRDHVFERGYSEADSGTGLGLAIVREVVQAHGWEIRVTESSNGGARFEITGVEFVDQTDI